MKLSILLVSLRETLTLRIYHEPLSLIALEITDNRYLQGEWSTEGKKHKSV